MERKLRGEIIEKYVNKYGGRKLSRRYGITYEQLRYIIKRDYQGYINPNGETQTLKIESIINYDEGYYQELFRSWCKSKTDS